MYVFIGIIIMLIALFIIFNGLSDIGMGLLVAIVWFMWRSAFEKTKRFFR